METTRITNVHIYFVLEGVH